MTPPEHATVAVELERLHGTMSTGFAEVKGSLAVLVERSTRTEEDVRRLRADSEEADKAIRLELDSVKRLVWMASGGAIVLGAVAGYVVQFLA